MSVGIVNVTAPIGDIDYLTVGHVVASGISTQTLVISGTGILQGYPILTTANQTALTGADGITVISGSNTTTISGFRSEFVTASGYLYTLASGGLHNVVEDLTPQLGGNLDINNFQIISTGAADIQIVPSTGGGILLLTDVTVDIQGADISLDGAITVAGNRIQNVGAPVVGSDAARLQDITNLNVAALVGVNGITVISGSNITTISGFRSEFVAASGYIQSQIGAIITDEIEPAIVGDNGFIFVSSGIDTIRVAANAIVSNSTNLTVTSGTNSVTLSPSSTPNYTSVTATTLSGTTITGTTGQFSGTVSAQIGNFSNSLTVSGLPVSVGGAGVTSITASGTTLFGAVTLAGIGGDYLHVSGQTVTISGGLSTHIADTQLHNKLSSVTVTRSGGYISRLDWANGDYAVVKRNANTLITTISGNVWKRTVVRDSNSLITAINWTLS